MFQPLFWVLGQSSEQSQKASTLWRPRAIPVVQVVFLILQRSKVRLRGWYNDSASEVLKLWINSGLVLNSYATLYVSNSHRGAHQNHLESLLKLRWLSLTLRVSDSVSLGWGQRTYMSNKFPGDNAGLGTTLWEPLLYTQNQMSEPGVGRVLASFTPNSSPYHGSPPCVCKGPYQADSLHDPRLDPTPTSQQCCALPSPSVSVYVITLIKQVPAYNPRKQVSLLERAVPEPGFSGCVMNNIQASRQRRLAAWASARW